MQPAITRVVKLTFEPDFAENFKVIFKEHRAGIAHMQGSISLQAYQDIHQPHVFFTISLWENEAALDSYRFSSFFKSLWGKVKPRFTEKAVAHSMLPL